MSITHVFNKHLLFTYCLWDTVLTTGNTIMLMNSDADLVELTAQEIWNEYTCDYTFDYHFGEKYYYTFDYHWREVQNAI